MKTIYFFFLVRQSPYQARLVLIDTVWAGNGSCLSRGPCSEPLGMPHPGQLITHLMVRERRVNKPSSDLFPAYTI